MQSAQNDYRNQLGFLIEQRVHGGVINHITGPTMNVKQTALDAYLARTAAIHAKLERLQLLADDHFGHDPDAIHWGHVGDLGRVVWRLGWASCWRSSARMANDDASQPLEMIMKVKLTATQATILKAAAARPDGNIEIR